MILANSRSKNVTRSIVWGFLNKVISILLPFVSRTAIIYYLGIEYTGLSSLFTSILSILSLAELGIGSALVFSMYKPVSENNIERINAFLNFYRKCFYVIGIAFLLLGLCLLPAIPFLISGDIPDNVNLFILYGVYLINNSASYLVLAYKSSVLIASQKNYVVNNVSSLILILKESIQLVILFLTKNYYFYVICLPIFTILQNIVISLIVSKKYPEIKPLGKLEKNDIILIKEKVIGLVFQKIGNVVLGSVDAIVISAFLGLKTLGIYNNYYFIITALFGFFAIIQTSLVPSVGNSIITESKDKNYKDFKKFHFLYQWCSIFCCSCLLALYQPFMKLWVGESNMLETGIVFLLPAFFFFYKLNDICSIYREACGLWKEWKFVNLIAAFVNLSVNIILVQFIGLYGVVISTIICLVMIYTPFFTFPLFKHYFESSKLFFIYLRDCLTYLIFGTLVCLFTYLSSVWINGEGIFWFIFKALITVLSSNVLLLIISLFTKTGKEGIQFILKSIKK